MRTIRLDQTMQMGTTRAQVALGVLAMAYRPLGTRHDHVGLPKSVVVFQPLLLMVNAIVHQPHAPAVSPSLQFLKLPHLPEQGNYLALLQTGEGQYRDRLPQHPRLQIRRRIMYGPDLLELLGKEPMALLPRHLTLARPSLRSGVILSLPKYPVILCKTALWLPRSP